MNAIPIPGIPEDSRFAYEPEGHPTARRASELQPGDTFLYRASPKAEPSPVEVVRIDILHVSGRVRVWAHRLRASRSLVTPFIAGTYPADQLMEVLDGSRP